MTLKESIALIGGLSTPSKMPCFGYSISAQRCKVGGKLQKQAGTVCSGCYAMRGNYRYQNVRDSHERRLKALHKPNWVEAMVIAIGGMESSGYFRWHDSGDLQGLWHLEKIAEVARRLPQIKFWLPTREYGVVREFCEKQAVPLNLTIRLSAYMIDGPLPFALASQTGCSVSGVSTKESNCPAPNQGNKCLACRKCWDSKEPVIYHKH